MNGPAGTDSAARSRRSVPWPVAASLLVLLLAAGGFAALFVSRAAADSELLADGIDRSSLPRQEAIALVNLASARSAPVPHDEVASHEHDDSMAMSHEMTPEQHSLLKSQIAEATATAIRYATLEEAEAAGYQRGSNKKDGVGAHWIKWSWVDRPFDPARPSMLLMDEIKFGKGPQLIALSYWVASEEMPEGFAGDSDQWHRHQELCFRDGVIKDEGFPREDCEGDWLNGVDLWMLHAWVVPGLENPHGVFATANPALCERICGMEN